MPKLHFHDSGLVCWLLGIREPEQLRSHPLRGAIFESWVVSEIVKHRTNRAETRGLSFYRDRSGAEVDLVIERPEGLTLVEAKAARTPSSTLFRGALRVQRHFKPKAVAGTSAGMDSSTPDVVVVYGGDAFQARSAGRLIPWRRVEEAAFS